MNTTKHEWPDYFDLQDTPKTEEIIKAFIQSQLDELKAYDALRPDGINYIFHEHASRVAGNIKKTCLYMGLGDLVAENMYWAVLVHDLGKRKLPVELWDSEEKPTGELKDQRRTHTDIGAEIIQRRLKDIEHPFKDLMLDIIINHHEHMDGSGFHGTHGSNLSKPARLASIVEAYDGWRIWRPHYGDRDISIPGVLKRMREEKGAEIFDMELFEAFAGMKMIEYNNGENQ